MKAESLIDALSPKKRTRAFVSAPRTPGKAARFAGAKTLGILPSAAVKTRAMMGSDGIDGFDGSPLVNLPR